MTEGRKRFGGRSARRRPVATALVLILVGSTLLSACGGTTAPRGDRVPGHRLTIYVSLPFQGPSGPSGEGALGGATMALAAARGHIGPDRIVLRVLDDATAHTGGWDPGQTTANAHVAIFDATTIGYVGDLNSGASAVSIPLLSRAGIPQISPTSTAVGLTQGGDEASPGEPQKYYPTGRRTFARVIPTDAAQASVQVRLQRASGCRRTYVVDDGEVDGSDEAMSFAVAAHAGHLPVTGPDQYDPRSVSYASLASAVAKSGANCVLIAALPQDNATLVTVQIAREVPAAKLFTGAGLAERSYAAGLPPSIASRMLITVATLDDRLYPPAGRRFELAYARRYGGWQPDAIFGYEAMSLMLDAISRATDGGTEVAVRSRVAASIFHTRDRHSVLGTYSIDRYGDTTLDRYGVYRIRDGRLVFWKALRATG